MCSYNAFEKALAAAYGDTVRVTTHRGVAGCEVTSLVSPQIISVTALCTWDGVLRIFATLRSSQSSYRREIPELRIISDEDLESAIRTIKREFPLAARA